MLKSVMPFSSAELMTQQIMHCFCATWHSSFPANLLPCTFWIAELWLYAAAALLDGIKLSVIDFWQVYYRSAGAKQALKFFCATACLNFRQAARSDAATDMPPRTFGTIKRGGQTLDQNPCFYGPGISTR
jgi:hypothetical protein